MKKTLTIASMLALLAAGCTSPGKNGVTLNLGTNGLAVVIKQPKATNSFGIKGINVQGTVTSLFTSEGIP